MGIVLYSTNCPKCKVLETKLKQKGIEYELNTNQDEMINKGFLSIPVLEVDGNTMDFLQANKWINEQEDN